MASLNSLPPEILEKVIMDIPGRPFKTELLLLNKALCYYFMTEQVRNLDLNDQQVDRWITIIINSDIKKQNSMLQYRSLLNKIFALTIRVREDLSQIMTGFISYCTNLRFLGLIPKSKFQTTPRWDVSLIFNSLPSSIIELYISRFLIGKWSGSINSLVNYARRNTKLKKLHFYMICIDEEVTRALTEFLKPNSAITRLCFSACEIRNASAHSLAEHLKHNITLTRLGLNMNFIGDEGACALAKCLNQNTTLIHLNLGGNKISDLGACALAKCLKQNTTLIHLNLGRNKIGDKGAYDLAESLRQNTTLVYLNLKSNKIGNDGGRALADGQKQNTTLNVLNVFGNRIFDRDILAACRRRRRAISFLLPEKHQVQ